MLSACLEKNVLRIAVWLVEIPGYVTKSRAIVTEAAWQAGKETYVRMVSLCLKWCVYYNKCIICVVYHMKNCTIYNVYVWYVHLSAKLKELNISLHIVIIICHNPIDFIVVTTYKHFWQCIILPFPSAFKTLCDKLFFLQV